MYNYVMCNSRVRTVSGSHRYLEKRLKSTVIIRFLNITTIDKSSRWNKNKAHSKKCNLGDIMQEIEA